MPPNDYDTIVVGSGFGGGVAALRLAESGRRVAVLERGRRVTPADMRDGARHTHKLLWAPRSGMRGYFRQTLLPHVLALGGVGVGGGSLVYANTLLVPPQSFYQLLSLYPSNIYQIPILLSVRNQVRVSHQT